MDKGFCEMPPGGMADSSWRIDSGRPGGPGGPSAPIGTVNKGASWTRGLSGLKGHAGPCLTPGTVFQGLPRSWNEDLLKESAAPERTCPPCGQAPQLWGFVMAPSPTTPLQPMGPFSISKTCGGFGEMEVF